MGRSLLPQVIMLPSRQFNYTSIGSHDRTCVHDRGQAPVKIWLPLGYDSHKVIDGRVPDHGILVRCLRESRPRSADCQMPRTHVHTRPTHASSTCQGNSLLASQSTGAVTTLLMAEGPV